MSPMQQIFLGLGAVADKTYVDDIFSTDLWLGTASNKTITNGINLSEDGGMVWIKNRPRTYQFLIQDTVGTGTSKSISTNSAGAQQSNGTNRINQFNTNGFRVGSDTSMNESNKEIVSWTFKQTPKFFDCVKYTGNGTARTISHNLESVPGMIVIKSLTEGGNWRVYHRGVNNGTDPENYYLRFNGSSGKRNDTSMWQDTAPTSSVFSVQADNNPDEAFYINKSGEEYIAYLFAGGESTAATACSVHFDGSNDYLYTSTSSSDVSFGTGDFTIELWFKYDGTSLTSTNDTLIDTRNGNSGGNADHGWNVFVRTNGHLAMFTNGSDGYGYAVESNTVLSVGQWYHAAITRSGNTYRLFLNGDLDNTNTQSTSADAGSNFYIGYKANYSASTLTYWNGLISNVRILKGTALYTSSFRPPTEPLTNITNTKFLWAQSSTVTTGTVNPMTLTNSGTTASTDSPFDDPAGFVFGDAGDQNVIKCGSYVGNGNADGPDIYVGFEPQWLLIKRTSSTEDWMMFDSMRTSTRTNMHLDDMRHDQARAEGDGAGGDSKSYLNWTSTGFKLQSNTAHTNGSGDSYIFCAIRRPDGYVGKPVELGTSVFAMGLGQDSTAIPNYISGFPVDMGMHRLPASTSSFTLVSRLMGPNYLLTPSDAAQGDASWATFDSNTGYVTNQQDNTHQAWMWKRHKGMDVITFKGNGSARQIPHSLNQIPEMILTKNRTTDYEWNHYHKGLNGGTNPEQYYLQFTTAAEVQNSGRWNDQAPTATHFSIGNHASVNANNADIIAMLFASVDGISKCGFYDADSNGVTVNCGFQPRFLIIKLANVAGDSDTWSNWAVFDSVRGFSSGNDKMLRIDTTAAEVTTLNMGEFTSTGFTLNHGFYTTNHTNISGTSGKYIYYAHA